LLASNTKLLPILAGINFMDGAQMPGQGLHPFPQIMQITSSLLKARFTVIAGFTSSAETSKEAPASRAFNAALNLLDF
jgi:hypothetical protein